MLILKGRKILTIQTHFIWLYICACSCNPTSASKRKKRQVDSDLYIKAAYETIFDAAPADDSKNRTTQELSDVVMEVAGGLTVEVNNVQYPSEVVAEPVVMRGGLFRYM